MNATLHQKPRAKPTNRIQRVLPLRNGDHLSRPEFELRWDATPGLTKAELIEGIVFMPPPTSDTHSANHGLIFHLLKSYAIATPGVKAGLNVSVRLDNKNEYQPDCLLRIESPRLGHARISADDYIEGAPELAAEIAVSSADYDAHEKRLVYERLGVQEYLLWQVMDARCNWWTLREGVYVPLEPRTDGVTRSLIFPGLWLDLQALLRGDEKRGQRIVDKGLASPAHAEFVKYLAAK